MGIGLVVKTIPAQTINEDLEGVWSTTITDSDSSSNNANQTLTFLSSGICAVNIWDHSGETYSATGTWSSTESTVTINWDNGETDTADYELSNNNNTCVITRSDGVVIVYTKSRLYFKYFFLQITYDSRRLFCFSRVMFFDFNRQF